MKQSIVDDIVTDERFILGLFLFDEKTIQDFVKDASILTDDHPYTEYPLLTWWWDKKKINVSTIMSKRSDVRELITHNP